MNLGDLAAWGAGMVTAAPVLSIILGLISCFLGVRIFRFILVAYGFIAGAVLASTVTNALYDGVAWIVGLAALAGGLVGAVLMGLLYVVGVFLVGALAGIWLANLLAVFLGGPLPPIVIIAIAVVLGFVATVFQRPAIVLTTAFGGALAVVNAGVALWTGQALNLNLSWGYLQAREPADAIQFGAFLAWMALGMVGAWYQFRSTEG